MQDQEIQLTSAYTKFFAQFSEIENIQIKDWKVVHLIAYFVQRYKDHYNIEYTMRMNHKSPNKCYEMWQMSKLTQMITKDMEVLKKYIDWVFEKKIIERKKRITSLAIFTDANNINEYKWNVLNSKTIDRTTKLPEKYMEIVRKIDENISTFGDLAFANKSDKQKYAELIKSLISIGLRVEDLEKVK